MGDVLEKVLKRCKLVALIVERIEIVIDGDIPNLPAWEQHFGVLTDLDIVSTETGQVLGDQRCHLALLHHFKQTLEVWAVKADARISVIHEYLNVLKTVVLCVFLKNGSLILNTVAIPLQLILLRETAIQRGYFVFILV